jgi:hypothetical protein
LHEFDPPALIALLQFAKDGISVNIFREECG